MNTPHHQNHAAKNTQHVASSSENDLRPTSMDDFDIIAQVGEGTYGRVYKACHKKSGRLCALKVVFSIEEEDGLSFTAIREIKYLQQLAKNPNVINLLGTFFTAAAELVLVFEYMENDLSGLLSLKDVEFTPAQIKCLMKQILEGLHQCHAGGIMHRDIKAANLLVTNGVLKLADFGLATNYTRRPVFSTNVVTLWYRAPELLLGVTKYKAKVDIWSAGCIFIELLTRQSPFPGNNEKHQMELIFRMCGTPSEENWPGVSKLEGYKLMQGIPQHRNRIREIFSNKIDPYALDLICKMLTLDPENRLTASQALDHDYFWTNPMPCQPSELPAYPPMHEYEAKKTRQTEQRQIKRQKGASYREAGEQPHSGFPGVRRPQIKVPGYPPAPAAVNPPLRHGMIGSLPGGEIVNRSAGQQYPPSVQIPRVPPSMSYGSYRSSGRERGSVGNGMMEHTRIGEKEVENGGGAPHHNGVSMRPSARAVLGGGSGSNHNGIYGQHSHHHSNGNGAEIRKWGGSRTSEQGVSSTGNKQETKEKMEIADLDGELEEGEIMVYNRPPSDHSLDSQPQPPTGMLSPPRHERGACGSTASQAAFAIVNTNRLMVAAGKRKRGDI